ncbi:MAG: ATP-binding cassette domain-containing protein [Candidatus Hydrothermarchaeaceae archaeon]
MIKIKELTKVFGDLTAVDRVSLEINEGEIFGFLGPNGAGKTTLISMLCTLLNPDSGSAVVMGYDVKEQARDIRKSIGIVFQDPSLDGKLTGRENLEISAILYRVPKNVRKERIDEVLDVVGLKDRADSFVRTYSMGMRRRLEIARPLIHNPRILFLDEPTLGLDPLAREWVWEHLKTLNQRGHTTIVLATNYMEEAERLCDRVGIVDRGRMITIGSPKELKEGLKGDVIILKVKNPEGFVDKFQGVDFIKDVKILDEKIVFIVENGENAIPGIVGLAGGEKVESIELHRPTLNDVFLHYTGKEIGGEGRKDNKKAPQMRRRRGRG